MGALNGSVPIATALLTMVIGILFNASLPAAGISSGSYCRHFTLVRLRPPAGRDPAAWRMVLTNGARYGYLDLSLGGSRYDPGKPGDRPDPGCFVRTIVGLLPGLGPINGVAILPLAFALHLPAESALILLATVYIGCEYGGVFPRFC